MPHSAGNQSVERENGGGGDRPTDGPSGRAGYRSRTIFPFVEIGWNVVPMQSVARMSEVTCLTARGFVREHISFVMTLFSSPHRRLLHFFFFFNPTNLIFSKAWCRPVVGAVSQSVGRKRGREGGRGVICPNNGTPFPEIGSCLPSPFPGYVVVLVSLHL